ncbi:MAG TPA: hypothetical protein VKA12_13960 [Roseiarcus sp.]|nr:hypothetical protein [Roseiarcus sp.]
MYGADDQKIGAIKDVLVGHDGATQVVVIGVGGGSWGSERRTSRRPSRRFNGVRKPVRSRTRLSRRSIRPVRPADWARNRQ